MTAWHMSCTGFPEYSELEFPDSIVSTDVETSYFHISLKFQTSRKYDNSGCILQLTASVHCV